MERGGEVVTATRERSAIIRTGIAVGAATATYGVSFGALSTLSGLDVWQTCFLSVVMFSGASQFAMISVLATGGLASAGSAIASAALLGSRNLFYAIRLSPIIGPGFWKRAAAAQLTIDESTALAVAQPTLAAQRAGFWSAGLAVFMGWNIATLIGVLIGDLLGDIRVYGLDAAAAAAFLGLLWPRLRERQAQAVAVAAAIVAASFTPVLPPGVPVLLTVVVAVIVGGFNLFAPKPSGSDATRRAI
jgi:predicted branched-subunit amino acid permease